MNQHSAESKLSKGYPIIVGAALICSICSAIVWNHWRWVLDLCGYDTNCGCILYGESMSTQFVGGNAAYCYWITYGPILPLIFALILSLFHGFRVCFGKGKTRSHTTTVRQRSGDMIVMTARNELNDQTISPYYWIPVSIISGIFTIWMLVYSIIYTHGFVRTCNQYRHELVKVMQLSGNQVAAVRGRLSCAAILDFMDYLHQDFSYERRREGRINTPAATIISLTFAWLSFVVWLWIFTINVRQSRASKGVRV